VLADIRRRPRRLISPFAGILGRRILEFFHNPLDVSGDASELRSSWWSSSAPVAASAGQGADLGVCFA
jgi:hypothetical protein